jgi:endoglucanase
MKFRILTIIILFLFHHRGFSSPPTVDNHIKIDQFGYRCNDQKIAIISNPQTGFNSASTFVPGTTANNYQIRNWTTDAVVFSGTLTAWNGGATHAQSGDKVWWFDFSAFTTAGIYYVFDVSKNVGSYQFEIRDDIYLDVMKQTVRSYYYQRCGSAKLSAHAGTGWADAACHIGSQQDADCRLYNNTNVTTSKNLSGGWHDAGDYNKYVNFAWGAVTDLLFAYEENPTVWTDDYNLPESGNGIPDLLDEVKYELDWLLKMQNVDGSVLSVVGGGGGSPPSSDANFRRYGPATTSASLSAASMFAQGAIVFKSLGIPAMTTYATTLQTAATNAWNWASVNTNAKFYNQPVSLAAGEQEFSSGSYTNDTLLRKLAAASFLYNLTGAVNYKTYFEGKYTAAHLIAWSFAYPFESSEQDILLYYTKAAGATPAVSTNIKNKYSASVSGGTDNLVAFTSQTDAYRSHLKNADIGWGSNSIKGKQASMFLTQNKYNLDAGNATNYTNAASGFLHYMHGTNPLAIVYISNMNAHGAEYSVSEFYHTWFADGSALWDRVGTSTYGPAPGFLPGGPNPGWTLASCCPGSCGSAANNALCVTLQPPAGQPVQKSFKDWNTNWPQDSWEVTENGIYYNASYIRLVSKFMATGTCGVTLGIEEESPAEKYEKYITTPKVLVHPNPFDQHTIVEVLSSEKEKIQIRILSMLGKEVLATKDYLTNEPIELGDDLPVGLFFIEIRQDHSISTVKLIKN